MINEIILKDIKTAFSTGMFHLFSSSVIIQGLAFIQIIIVARLLNPSDIGHIGVMFAVIGFVSVIAGLGLNTAVLKYVSEPITQREKEKILFHSLVWTAAVSILISSIVFIGTFIRGILADEIALYYLRFLVWTIPVTAIFSIVICYFHAEKQIRTKAYIELSQKVMGFIAVIIAVYFFALSGYVFANILVLFITGLFSVFLLRKRIKTFEFDKHLTKIMFKFGGFSFLANSFALVVTTADILCVSYLLKDPSLVGFYTIAVSLVRGVRLIPQSIIQTAFPYISEKSGDTQATKNLYFSLLKKMALLMGFVCLVAYILGGKIVLLAFGTEYLHSVPIFNVLVIGLFFWSVGISGDFLLARGKPNLNFYTVVIEGIINIILNIFFIQQMGIIGAAWATSITYFIRFVINYLLCQYDLKH